MPDVGTWGAAITAGGAAIAAVIAAARQPADVAALRGEVKSAREEAPAKVKEAIDAVRAAFDASLSEVRSNLASVAKRVGALEDWRKHAHAVNEGRATVVSGSDLAAQVDREHERRIANLEARADRTDSALGDAREKLAGILATVQEILRRAK